ncbi:hypothetical protein MSG28_014386 [Choristoneura fumiferana]|uniref:Uncharacterized protein n=1 Tax=Choristoneura fumiferana TaxID=7141 RepID=A0ACC0JR76_CHOFU|nr:hypothetical protein MSG28_014386 [Choristoneura fumiferana]
MITASYSNKLSASRVCLCCVCVTHGWRVMELCTAIKPSAEGAEPEVKQEAPPPPAVKQERRDDADDTAAPTADRAEPTTVKQECSDAAADGSEESCASSECSGEYLKEEPADTAGCDAELLMSMVRPCTVRLSRALVHEYCASTPRAAPRHDAREPGSATRTSPMRQKVHAQEQMLALTG